MMIKITKDVYVEVVFLHNKNRNSQLLILTSTTTLSPRSSSQDNYYRNHKGCRCGGCFSPPRRACTRVWGIPEKAISKGQILSGDNIYICFIDTPYCYYHQNFNILLIFPIYFNFNFNNWIIMKVQSFAGFFDGRRWPGPCPSWQCRRCAHTHQ